MVFDPHSAVSFGYQKQNLSLLSLPDDGVFRQEQLGSDIVDDEVCEFLVSRLEYRIRSYGIHEDVLGDLVPEAGRDHLHEVIQFFLSIEIVLSGHHELADLVLKLKGHFDVDHGGIGDIYFFLEL